MNAITVRLIMPDRWLEHVADLPAGTTVADAKAFGIRAMLQRSSDDPADFYTEFAERRIRDETRTLADVGIGSSGVLSIRAYDLGHYPPFRG
ncbi:MAG: hypothetical protein F4Z33_02885 [Gemmatimonadales bacterium]|nr:hypothetical protein [Gemmatimonadales bacterium]MXX77933.1 hypothetical protein [Gemmatimonadales bacterium]MYC89613.1 hypothetical protein [Candidatus Palauibacter denitrificans]